MAGSTSLVIAKLLLLAQLGLLVTAHYTDDSDYNDFDYYKDLPENPIQRSGHQDDFYIVSEPDEAEDRSHRVVGRNDAVMSSREGKWPTTERVYRYTKHRIPGYDYDELDLLESRRFHRCDERSVWTHCLCQFTCADPNIVDCYTPCSSGCECREDFVYDEQVQQCVPPDQCQPDADYLLY